ncbi:hypothetical protein D3C80_953640 [compost metagenome]
MFARSIVLPATIRFHDRQQFISRIFTTSLRIAHLRKIKPCLIILWIGLHAAFQFNRITDEFHLICKRKTCFKCADRRCILLVFGQARQNLTRLIGIARFKQACCKTNGGIHIVRCNLQDRREYLRSLHKIASLNKFRGGIHRFGNRCFLIAWAANLSDEFLDFGFRQSTHKAICGLAIDEGNDRRN